MYGDGGGSSVNEYVVLVFWGGGSHRTRHCILYLLFQITYARNVRCDTMIFRLGGRRQQR